MNEIIKQDLFKFKLSNILTKDKYVYKEEGNWIHIPTRVFDKCVARYYLASDKKIDAMFKSFSWLNGMVFHKFFKFEFIKILESILKRKHRYGIDIKAIEELYDALKPSEEDIEKFMSLYDRAHVEKVMNFKILPHQELPIRKYMEFKHILGYNGMLLHGGVGTGKAQPLDCNILTENGWVRMGDIKVGDKVVTESGLLTTVTGVFPRGKRKVFKIIFEDGRSTRCCIDHLWDIWEKDHNNDNKYIRVTTGTRYLLNLDLDKNEVGIPLLKSENTDLINKVTSLVQDKCIDLKDHNTKYIGDYLIHKNDVYDGFVDDVRLIGGKCKLVDDIYDVYLPTYNNYKNENKHTCITNGDKKDMLKISKIEDIGYDEVQCIMVDDKSHMYVTDDYILTHNTAMSLFTMEGLHKELDHIIILCPLPTFNEVWTNALDGNPTSVYKEKQSYYSIRSMLDYNKERFIVCHFEGLEKLIPIAKKLPKGRVGVIIDESHYLAEEKSKRTTIALELINIIESKNILLLSGTPIKAGFRELATVFSFLDPNFDSVSKERYFNLYKSPSSFLEGVLKERYNGYTTVVKKESINLEPVSTINIKIPVPDEVMSKYYLTNIRKDMVEFVAKRKKEIFDKMDYWIKTYKELRDKGIERNPSLSNSDVKRYEEYVEVVKRTLPFDYYRIKEQLVYANDFEKNQIMPYLEVADKSLFGEAKTIYKYPMLKIRGEALANIVMKRRIECHAMMVDYIDFSNILGSSKKKTIIFSNYIDVCKKAMDVLKNYKYKPIGVFGEETKNLDTNVSKFDKDPDIDPLVTTYKSLSTGVPLIMADKVICIDMPFRMYIYEQAVARAWRLGQDSKVTIYIPELDTDIPNINSRNIDIISYFKEEVEKITGIPSSVDISSESDTSYISAESLGNSISVDDYTEISIEADKSNKRRKVEDLILQYIAKIATGDENVNLYKNMFKNMNDKQFDEYMHKLKNNEITLSIVVPNGSKTIKCNVENNIRIGKELGFEFFQNLKFSAVNDIPSYTTPNRYLILKLPVKRASQLLDKKISVSKDAKSLDSLTGQVTGDSKSSKMSGPEIQVLLGLGCKQSLIELLKIRGGDLGANYALEQMLIKNGVANQSDIMNYATGVKSTDTLKTYLTGAHISSTL